MRGFNGVSGGTVCGEVRCAPLSYPWLALHPLPCTPNTRVEAPGAPRPASGRTEG